MSSERETVSDPKGKVAREREHLFSALVAQGTFGNGWRHFDYRDREGMYIIGILWVEGGQLLIFFIIHRIQTSHFAHHHHH